MHREPAGSAVWIAPLKIPIAPPDIVGSFGNTGIRNRYLLRTKLNGVDNKSFLRKQRLKNEKKNNCCKCPMVNNFEKHN